MPHAPNRRRITWIVVILIVLVFVGGGALHLFYAPPVKIKVSPETTYITEPLGPDGLPDYVAAINDMLRPEGVTPETNGVVAMLRAFGGDVIDDGIREAFLRELGLTELPPEGLAPMDIDEYIKTIGPELRMAIPEDFDLDKWNEEFAYRTSAFLDDPFSDPLPELPEPETPDQDAPAWDPEHDTWHLTKERVEEARRTGEKILPVNKYGELLSGPPEYLSGEDLLARMPLEVRRGFIDAQDELLRQLQQAVDRPHWYAPVVAQSDGTMDLGFSILNNYRRAARALGERIRFRIQQGNLQEARDDILLGYRFANRVAGEGFVINYLVGVSMRAIIDAAAFDIVKSGKFEAEQLKALRRAMAQAPPMPDFISVVERERYFTLHYISFMDNTKKDISSLIETSHLFGPKKDPPALAPLLRTNIDYNVALRSANESYDRIHSILTSKHALDRRDALRHNSDRDQQGYKKLTGELDSTWGQVKLVLMGQIARRRRVSDQLGRMALIGFLEGLEESRLESQVNNDLLITGLALAEYRARHGEYPERLDALVPEYLDAVPNDRFLPTPTPLIYRPHPDGFALYSVGRNGVNDGGRPDDRRQQDIKLLVNPSTPEPEPEDMDPFSGHPFE